jgi:anti-sigma factor RsiW
VISDEALVGYLDGHVDLARAREIEAALAGSAELRRRLEALQAGDASLREAFDALLEEPVPDALTARIRAAAAAAERDKVVRLRPERRAGLGFGGLAVAARAGFGVQPAWLGWAAAAQFAGLIVLSAAVIQLGRQPAAYHALGAAPQPADANLIVVFRPQTPERTLSERLRAADARVVGGPTEAGAWVLHVTPAGRSDALVKLRGDPEVTLAEPLDAPGGR